MNVKNLTIIGDQHLTNCTYKSITNQNKTNVVRRAERRAGAIDGGIDGGNLVNSEYKHLEEAGNTNHMEVHERELKIRAEADRAEQARIFKVFSDPAVLSNANDERRQKYARDVLALKESLELAMKRSSYGPLDFADKKGFKSETNQVQMIQSCA